MISNNGHINNHQGSFIRNVSTLDQSKSEQTTNDNKTINNVYLHPGHHSGEFENWMRTIGGLLQISKEFSSLRPLLDMLVAVLEPSRIFLVPHAGIEKFEVKPQVEIILVLTGWKDLEDEKLIAGILSVVSMKYCEVSINIFSEQKWDDGIEEQNHYFITHCRGVFLVFSGSPYRILEADLDGIASIRMIILELFEKEVFKSMDMMKQCEALFKEETSSDLLYGITSACLKQFYRMVIKPFLLNFPLLSYSCTELQELASRIVPQARNLKIKDLDRYMNWAEEELLEDVVRDCYLPSFSELQNCFEILKTAFEQKMTMLFETN